MTQHKSVDAGWLPAPWSLSRRSPRMIEAGQQSIAQVIVTNGDYATANAHVHLIAAAPALYHALAEMVKWNIKRGPFDEPLGESEQDPEVNRARAALSSARGES